MDREFEFLTLSVIDHAPTVPAMSLNAKTWGSFDFFFRIGMNCEYEMLGE